MKNIIYIHGYNSSGSTGKYLQEKLKGKYNVFAPKIPDKYDEAIEFLNRYIKENNIDLIVGTSLGGFMTLSYPENIYKIAINPVFDPYNDLAKIDAPIDTYKSYDGHSIFDNENLVTTNVYGLFGGEDKLVHYYSDFQDLFYPKTCYYVSDMEHQIKSYEIDNELVPLIDYIFNK